MASFFFHDNHQLASDKRDTLGGIKVSHPINGGYHPWQYPNWAMKFAPDPLIMKSANDDLFAYESAVKANL